MFRIYHNIDIKTSAERLTEACSVPAHINNWWTKKCAGNQHVGSEYMFWFAPDFDWRAILIEYVKDRKVVYQFTEADKDWTDTILTFRIEPLKNIPRLHFYHDNWKEENDHFGRTSFCWALYLNTLKDYLEKGLIVDYQNRGGS